MKSLLTVLLLGGMMMGQNQPDNLPQLKTAAAKKGLHWMVACMREYGLDEDYAFFAYAEVPGHSSRLYIEDGGKAEWTAHGATQRQVIANLIVALAGPENLHPDHRPVANSMKHKQCPPPLEGGPTP